MLINSKLNFSFWGNSVTNDESQKLLSLFFVGRFSWQLVILFFDKILMKF
jgi:hypothetical protein